jgi:hypothetical protein
MKKILVLNHGWVVVGDVTQEGTTVVVNDASVIRRWGTVSGLGQLALEGKQANTVLDPCGTVRVHERNVVLAMDITESASW